MIQHQAKSLVANKVVGTVYEDRYNGPTNSAQGIHIETNCPQLTFALPDVSTMPALACARIRKPQSNDGVPGTPYVERTLKGLHPTATYVVLFVTTHPELI